jgi:peptide chain release factor 2
LTNCKRSNRKWPNASTASGGFFDVDNKLKELEVLDKAVAAPDFWNDSEAAQKSVQKRSILHRSVNLWKDLAKESDDLEATLTLLAEEEDDSLLGECETIVSDLEKQLEAAELKAMLSGESDVNNAIVAINSGAGGTESQDWAEMLLRMYIRWGERNDYKTEVLDMQYGEEAGIKSATVNFIGEYAYGYLKAEIGVHRLVRISPYDSNKRRHTSFASVFVYPEVAEDVDVEINPDDLKIDVYRSSGPGGQGVNTTDSAVRITHKPSGIVVQCQNERSQHKNKASAMKVLRSRIHEMELEKKDEEKKAQEKEKKKIEWGSQIRSYVLHPYQMAKDLRTGVEMGNVEAVLDGDLGRFIEAFLLKKNVTS